MSLSPAHVYTPERVRDIQTQREREGLCESTSLAQNGEIRLTVTHGEERRLLGVRVETFESAARNLGHPWTGEPEHTSTERGEGGSETPGLILLSS